MAFAIVGTPGLTGVRFGSVKHPDRTILVAETAACNLVSGTIRAGPIRGANY